MPSLVHLPLEATAALKSTSRSLLRSCVILATVGVVGLLVPRAVSAGLIMRIDTDSKTFFMEGSDTGNANFRPDTFDEESGEYSLQFIHFFQTTVPEFATITPNPQSLFVEEIPAGTMSMIPSFFLNYIFMDLSSFSSDITTLTGSGPSAAVSYAGLPAANIPLFESLIGLTLELNNGSGYSAISVQAVPEPSTYCMALVGIACGGYLMGRLRKRT